MIRFLFRVLATLALAVAVIMAVLDATRSIAADRLVTTPLLDSWRAAFPGQLDASAAAFAGTPWAFVWDPIALTVLSLPGFAVFGGLALLFYLIGHRRQRRTGRFAAA